jgi:AraC family transcriptional regulator of adaptative response / DNA-3-methyladenine glycosylase II
MNTELIADNVPLNKPALSDEQCREARLSRDVRYDGLFFIAVKTTGIYCRSVCPARAPLEKNVEYFQSAVIAANKGYRPCLRCRPDSAPGSPAWQGKNTTLHRAIHLIDEGALQQQSLTELAERLGISDRYLRMLFQQELGLSPIAYSHYQQCLFAKKLLHDTQLNITSIALASGFNSVRRFNDCFKKLFSLTPTQVRKNAVDNKHDQAEDIVITLSYRPPYNWRHLQQFYAARIIEGLEWCDENSYGRTFSYDSVDGFHSVPSTGERIGDSETPFDCIGEFTAFHIPEKSAFSVRIQLSDLRYLNRVIRNIRRCLDLDADIEHIEARLKRALNTEVLSISGLRLPGVWSPFEAGIRAILGQQVSVQAARNLVTKVVGNNPINTDERCYFPLPQQLIGDELTYLKMPGKRKETIRLFADYARDKPLDDSKALLAIVGIGPWTVHYLRMRGLSDPDIFLIGDLGIKKALVKMSEAFSPDAAAPWRSYLTLYLWSADLDSATVPIVNNSDIKENGHV